MPHYIAIDPDPLLSVERADVIRERDAMGVTGAHYTTENNHYAY